MKAKTLFIFLTTVLSVFFASAQAPKRVYFGGNLGFSFGSETSVMVEPTVLYGFSQYFKLGGGVSYRYVSSDRYDYSDNIYGARAIAIATPLPYINISVDYGMYHRTTKISSGGKDKGRMDTVAQPGHRGQHTGRAWICQYRGRLRRVVRRIYEHIFQRVDAYGVVLFLKNASGSCRSVWEKHI